MASRRRSIASPGLLAPAFLALALAPAALAAEPVRAVPVRGAPVAAPPASAGLDDAALVDRAEWATLAQRQAERVAAMPADTRSVRDIASAALYAHLAGQPIDDAVATLVDGAAAKPQVADETAAALLLLDRNDAAVDVLLAAGRNATAFDMLAGEMRLSEALALPAPDDGSDDAVGFALSRAHALAGLGRADDASGALDRMAGASPAPAPGVAARVIREQAGLGLRGQALSSAITALSVKGGADRPWPVLAALWPGRMAEASAAWTTLRRQDPTAAVDVTLARVADVLDPTRPSADVDALLQQGAAEAVHLSPCEQGRTFEGLAGIANLRGRPDQELALTRQWADLSGAANAWLDLADLLAGRKEWALAAQSFAKATAVLPNEGAPIWLQGSMLEKQGDVAGAQALYARAEDVASRDESSRYRLAFAMERGGDTKAAERVRELILSSGAVDSPIVAATAQLLGRQSSCSKAFDAAVLAFDRARVHALLQPTLSVQAVSCLVRGAQSALLKGAIGAGRIDDVLPLADHALEPFLTNLDATVDLARSLTDAGRGSEADTLLARVSDRVAIASEAFPESAHLLNARAWLGARTGRDLDAARQAAEHAVALAPNNAGLVDTLAEVRFQQGDRAGAIEVGKRALALMPSRPYFQAQVTRFTSGDPSTKPPLELE